MGISPNENENNIYYGDKDVDDDDNNGVEKN